MRTLHRCLATLTILALIVTSCGAGRPTAGYPSGGVVMAADLPEEPVPPFVLSEGIPEYTPPERPPLAETTPLDRERLQQLLRRLPTLEVPAEDVQEYALPEETLPPPRPGQEVDLPFPPPDTRAAPPSETAGPLEVVRYAPEGDVPIAPNVSVTFNQPMVPLGTHDQLEHREVPVRLSPQVPGRWRWIGTRTVLFEPEGDSGDRLPMATEYTVEIPAGTRSALGAELAQAVRWTFRTPPPTLEQRYPTGGPHDLEPLIFAAFDQRIDPQAVLPFVDVSAGRRSFPVRLATQEEIDADPSVSRLVEDTPEGRWIAFRPAEPLPKDTTVNVVFQAGMPSAEGPRTTERSQSFSFQTYGPLRLVRAECAWAMEEECPPFTPWILEFSNPLDGDTFDPAWVTVTPELPGMRVQLFGNALSIQGNTQPRTTYQVVVQADLRDVFGQSLEEPATATFRVGQAAPLLSTGADNFVVLDPAADPSFSVYSLNVDRFRVRAYAVEPTDFPDYLRYLADWAYRRNAEDRPDPPGRLVLDRVFSVSEEDVLVETSVDLREALGGATGNLILVVEPELGFLAGLLDRELVHRLENARSFTWVQVTQIGLDAFVDQDEMVVWTNRLQDGAPLGGVSVSLWPGGPSGTTDETGLARLDLPSSGSATLLLATQGEDVAFIPRTTYFYDSGAGWQRTPEEQTLRWYVFDDRQMYRPGETVHVKGWLRRIDRSPDGDVTWPQGVRFITFTVRDPRGNEIAQGEVPVNDLGGFHLQFDLPENMNLGYTTVEMRTNTLERYHHSIQVQEFRRPEFEVTTSASPGPYLADEHAIVSVEARYFAGGPLPGTDVNWLVTASEGSYRPPNWNGFVFGRWTPWWRFVAFEDFDFLGGILYSENFASRTDAAGRHDLRIDFRPVDPPQPLNITAEATVFDVNRQAWSSQTTLLVHPAALYVGLRSTRYFVEAGEPLEVEIAVTTIDGKAVPGHPVQVRAARLEWAYRNGQWTEEEKDVQECRVRTTAADSPQDPRAQFATCVFDTAIGGTYRITATIQDGQGRRNETTLTRWVSGGQRPPSRELEQEEILLIPNAESYQPGDVAEILVQAPFFPAEGLLTLRRDGLVTTERFTLDGPTHTLQIPIRESYVPNVFVQVDLVGSAPRLDDQGRPLEGAPPRPAYASGYLDLSVPPLTRTLQVEARPRETVLEPGGQTTLELQVTDAAGEPVADAELAVVVVDEAILSLTDYRIPDPIQVFYTSRGMGVQDYHNRAEVLLARPDRVLQEVGGMGGGGAVAMERSAVATEELFMAEEAPAMAAAPAEDMGAPAEEPAIRVRVDFTPLALFAPAVRTDQEGRATIPVTLPDSLTRYRVMVVAVAGENRFGSGEANITARLPLMVRPSPPRFLNFGDRFELPLVLQNQTDQPLEVALALQASNVDLTVDHAVTTEVGEAAGVTVVVPANDRVEVRFPATTQNAGTARFQVGATVVDRPEWADAAQVSLPVWTPATTEAFAVYGTVDQEGAIVQPFLPPEDVVPVYGGLEISTSSTALQALTDAYIYLVQYPFECSEQIASRLLGIAALRDVLAAFDAPGLPSAEEIQQTVIRDLQVLQAMQNPDGGFPIWRRGDPSWPYYSIHVAHALVRIQEKGYPVPERMLDRALDHLRAIEDHIPGWYSRKSRNTLVAYALYVRSLLGDVDLSRAIRLWQGNRPGEDLSLEAMGWLLSVMAQADGAQAERQAILRYLMNNVAETAGAANFVDSYADDTYLLLYSNRRADAVILDGLMAEAPDSDLIPKVVRGLLAHRTKGRWANTQENAFVLLALDRYFQVYEAQSPDFVARAWLGDRYVGGHTFQGRTTEIATIQVPMQAVQEMARQMGPGDETLPIILQKEGQGRLYYRLGLRYAPTDLRLDPADHGFTVTRVYEAVDDPEDVWQDDDGVWHVRAGARVRVRITLVAESRRYHVALVDPLPAGLEPLNPELAATGTIPTDPQERARRFGWWWWRNWYEHQNLRDERAEAFTSLLWAGVYEYTYVARATTPGRFVVPPAKAEEMYAPEVFGRSGTDFLVVEVPGPER